MTNFYLKAPDGRCAYAVPTERYNLAFEGQVGAHRRIDNKNYAIVVTDGPVDDVWFTFPKSIPTGWFTLRNPEIPMDARISPEKWEKLPEELRELYAREMRFTEERESVSVAHHVPLPVEGEPVEVPRNWHPTLLADLYGGTFTHLFPGFLSGFKARALEIAKEYGDAYDNDGPTAPIKCFVRSWFHPPKTIIEGRGKSRRVKETCVTSQVSVRVNDRVHGANLFAAQEAWAAAEQEVRDQLAPYRENRTCGHCNGYGFVVKGKEHATDV